MTDSVFGSIPVNLLASLVRDWLPSGWASASITIHMIALVNHARKSSGLNPVELRDGRWVEVDSGGWD